MDLIASHRQGLIDQLEAETMALSGRPGDHLQRAMVLHHVYDHSRGSHGWALVEAVAALRLARGLRRLERKLDGWSWRGARRDQAKVALDQLAATLGEAQRARCAAAYRAYRLTATPALASEVDNMVGGDLAAGLNGVHAARRRGVAVTRSERRGLVEQSERAAAEAVKSEAVQLAWAAIAATVIGKTAARLLAPPDALAMFDRAERKDWARIEAEVTGAAELPTRFRANSAQHFYAMLRDLEERRRNEWREALDLDPAAVEMAA